MPEGPRWFTLFCHSEEQKRRGIPIPFKNYEEQNIKIFGTIGIPPLRVGMTRNWLFRNLFSCAVTVDCHSAELSDEESLWDPRILREQTKMKFIILIPEETGSPVTHITLIKAHGVQLLNFER